MSHKRKTKRMRGKTDTLSRYREFMRQTKDTSLKEDSRTGCQKSQWPVCRKKKSPKFTAGKKQRYPPTRLFLT
jgi:hypothetical protein